MAVSFSELWNENVSVEWIHLQEIQPCPEQFLPHLLIGVFSNSRPFFQKGIGVQNKLEVTKIVSLYKRGRKSTTPNHFPWHPISRDKNIVSPQNAWKTWMSSSFCKYSNGYGHTGRGGNCSRKLFVALVDKHFALKERPLLQRDRLYHRMVRNDHNGCHPYKSFIPKELLALVPKLHIHLGSHKKFSRKPDRNVSLLRFTNK